MRRTATTTNGGAREHNSTLWLHTVSGAQCCRQSRHSTTRPSLTPHTPSRSDITSQVAQPLSSHICVRCCVRLCWLPRCIALSPCCLRLSRPSLSDLTLRSLHSSNSRCCTLPCRSILHSSPRSLKPHQPPRLIPDSGLIEVADSRETQRVVGPALDPPHLDTSLPAIQRSALAPSLSLVLQRPMPTPKLRSSDLRRYQRREPLASESKANKSPPRVPVTVPSVSDALRVLSVGYASSSSAGRLPSNHVPGAHIEAIKNRTREVTRFAPERGQR